jgi:hypothetical protein
VGFEANETDSSIRNQLHVGDLSTVRKMFAEVSLRDTWRQIFDKYSGRLYCCHLVERRCTDTEKSVAMCKIPDVHWTMEEKKLLVILSIFGPTAGIRILPIEVGFPGLRLGGATRCQSMNLETRDRSILL